MKSDEIVRHIIDCLENVNIAYVIVGSYASNSYGIIRSTKDVDFVLQTQPGNISILMQKLGTDFKLDPQVQFETVTGTRKLHVTHTPTGFEVELFELSDDAHDQERFSRKKRMKLAGRDAWILSPEDVLVTKLRWLHTMNRGKDLLDIQSVIAVQNKNIDWPYVEQWCDQHGSRKLLDQIRTEVEKKLI